MELDRKLYIGYLLKRIYNWYSIECNADKDKIRRALFSWTDDDSDFANELREKGYEVLATKQISL
mgnify:CR=1 FL=1